MPFELLNTKYESKIISLVQKLLDNDIKDSKILSKIISLIPNFKENLDDLDIQNKLTKIKQFLETENLRLSKKYEKIDLEYSSLKTKLEPTIQKRLQEQENYENEEDYENNLLNILKDYKIYLLNDLVIIP